MQGVKVMKQDEDRETINNIKKQMLESGMNHLSNKSAKLTHQRVPGTGW
ncbi:MAG: hypothetical protein ACLVJ6_13675 [Merdibacter sp.]